MSQLVLCSACEAKLMHIDLHANPRVPCPRCGSTARTHQASATASAGMTSSASAQTKSKLSYSHIQSASYFTRRSGELEQLHAGSTREDMQGAYDEHRAYVIGAILASASFLEASINELYSDAADTPSALEPALGSEVTARLGSRWNKERFRSYTPTLSKYQTALRVADKREFDTNTAPYADTRDLLELRNELVHFKPEFRPGPVSGHWTDTLQGRFAPNGLFPQDSGNPFFPDKSLGHSCAAWALHTALRFTDDFHARLGLQDRYERERRLITVFDEARIASSDQARVEVIEEAPAEPRSSPEQKYG